jgi:hypothetical protein
MKRALALLCVASAAIFLLISCAAKQPARALQASVNATFELLADAHDAGVISDADFAARVAPAARAAYAAVDAAIAIEEGGQAGSVQAYLEAAGKVLDAIADLVKTARDAKAAKAAVKAHKAGAELPAIIELLALASGIVARLIGLLAKAQAGQFTEADKAQADELERKLKDKLGIGGT